MLVENEGYGLFDSAENIPLSKAKHQFEVNLLGIARLILPTMRSQHNGRIIKISPRAGEIEESHVAWHRTTKFTVEG